MGKPDRESKGYGKTPRKGAKRSSPSLRHSGTPQADLTSRAEIIRRLQEFMGPHQPIPDRRLAVQAVVMEFGGSTPVKGADVDFEGQEFPHTKRILDDIERGALRVIEEEGRPKEN